MDDVIHRGRTTQRRVVIRLGRPLVKRLTGVVSMVGQVRANLYNLLKDPGNVIIRFASSSLAPMFFRSLFRAFNPKALLLPTAVLVGMRAYRATVQENERINQKLKKKLDKLYHHNTDLSKDVS